MFIELTDHLRCPMRHDESFLVLLPSRTEGRRVVAGQLGCPRCGWESSWDDGIPDFGGGEPAQGALPFDADAAVAMLGIDGPGGWLAMVGNAGAIAHDASALLAGVNIVAINPPVEVLPADSVSVIRSGPWPLKRAALRGLVLGSDAGERAGAVGSVLPGLRVCGSGTLPDDGVEMIATGGDAWVVRRL